MERRPLGDSQLQVSAIGLGTWAMGGHLGTWGQVDDRESIATIHQALDLGINLIDTAPTYGLGHSEEIVGRAMQGRRHQVLLATKCGLLFPAREGQTPERCLTRSSILRECEASLRRMRTDVIDLYECHWPDPRTPLRETMEALALLREQGKVRAIGVSNFSCEQIAAAREFGPIHALQIPFSMVDSRADDDLIPFCVEHRMAVLAYSSLAKGLLTGKFGPESQFTGVRGRDPAFHGERYRQHLALVESLRPIAARYGKTLTQLVVNWTAHRPGLTTPILGAKRPSQILESAGGLGWSLTLDDRAVIDRLVKEASCES